MAQGLLHGPRPADEALEALAGALPPNPYPAAMLVQSQLLAMLGRGEEARRLAEEQAARLSEIEGPRRRRGEEDLAVVAVYEGDYEKAVEAMTMRVAALEESDHSSFLSTQAPKLGRWLCLAGRYDDAERYARLGRDLGDERDHATQTLWRQAQALVHSGRGEHEEAERLAREAVQVADRSDNLNSQGETRADLGLILTAAGRGADAAPVLEEAIDRFERKRNVVMAGRARERLAEIRKENR
jgi:tetratricopeptide (TPR) repeat protein